MRVCGSGEEEANNSLVPGSIWVYWPGPTWSNETDQICYCALLLNIRCCHASDSDVSRVALAAAQVPT